MSDDLVGFSLNVAPNAPLQPNEAAKEIERLRAALRKITEVEPSHEYDWGMQCIDIALEALGKKR